MSKGIIANFIEQGNFGNNSSIENAVKISSLSNISDLIRFRSGNFLFQGEKSVSMANSNKTRFPIEITFLEDNKIRIIANKDFFSSKKYDKGFVKTYFDENLWKTFLYGGSYQNNSYAGLIGFNEESFNVYTDHFSFFNQPVNFKNPVNKNNVGINYYNAEFYYNYFSPLYETAIGNYNVNEQTIPDFYSFSRYFKNPETAFNEVNRISLGGAVKGILYKNLINKNNPLEIKKQYFEEYGKVHDNEISNISLRNQLSVKDIILEEKDLENKNIQDYSFPLYSAIEFYNEGKLDINNAIAESNLSSNLLNFYIQNFTAIPTLDFFFFNKKNERYKTAVKVFDLKEWHKQNINFIINQQDNNDSIINSFNLSTLTKKINEISKKSLRTLKEVFEGKQAYSELLVYKIEKFFNNPKGLPIQTFYFFPNESSIIKFFDTQVKHNRKYSYKVTAIVAVIGNEYNYSDYYKDLNNDLINSNDISNGFFTVKYTNKSSIKLLELPYFTVSGKIIEKPVSTPEASFNTFKLLDNKIKIKINKIQKTEPSLPISVESEDSKYFEDLLEAQDNEEKNKFFANEDLLPTKIQIYKTTTKPNYYFDFSGKLFNTIEQDIKSEMFFNDLVVPNVKYYYTFRYLNNHNYPSNPSKVYQVELKSEDKINYLEVKEVEMGKGIHSVNEKKFKNLLQITPSVKQTIFKENLEELQQIFDKNEVENITLGISEKLVWGKKFKLRITSRKTGKKIDINFNFNIARKGQNQ